MPLAKELLYILRFGSLSNLNRNVQSRYLQLQFGVPASLFLPSICLQLWKKVQAHQCQGCVAHLTNTV